MRSGEDLVPMTPDMLKRIFDETGPDFSAEICPKATLADLDTEAVEEFRRRWILKTGKENLKTLSVEQLLTDIEVVVDGGITYAALWNVPARELTLYMRLRSSRASLCLHSPVRINFRFALL